MGCNFSVDLSPTAGDQRGVLVATDSTVYYTGDSSSVAMSAADLSGVVVAGVMHDTLVSDLRASVAYVMLTGSGTEPVSGAGGVISQLGALDASGRLTATRASAGSSSGTTPAWTWAGGRSRCLPAS
jgi:hypothetical protein